MSTSQLARANRASILQFIFDEQQVGRPAISTGTGLAPATVNRLTSQLIEANLVQAGGSDQNTGGRPTLLLEFNNQYAHLLAVDVADRHTDLALIDLAGVAQHRLRVPAEHAGGQPRITETLELIAEQIAHATTNGLQVVGVGVSVPGPVSDGGVVDFAPALDWLTVPLGNLVTECTGLACAVENDANAAALAQSRYASHRELRSLVSIAVYDGLGAGIVQDGKLWRGRGGAAGQVGRMLLGASGLAQEYSGLFGETERRIGGAGLRERAVLIPEIGSDAEEPLAQLFDLLAQQHVGAGQLINEIQDDLAVTLVNICAVLDPDTIVIDGVLAPHEHLLLPGVQARMSRQVLHMPTIRMTEGAEDKLKGAALLALERRGGIVGLL